MCLLCSCIFSCLAVYLYLLIYSPPDGKGLLDFMLESAFAMLLHQWIPPSIPPELLASRASRRSSSPVDPAEYPARAARQWIPPSIPPEQLASGSRPVSRQSCSPVDPPQERLASGSRRVSRQSSPPVDPAEYPRVACQWIPLSIPCRWILPSIRPVSSRSGSPEFASGSRQYPARAACQSGFA